MSNDWAVYREPTKAEEEVIVRFGVDPTKVVIWEEGKRKHLIPRQNLDRVTGFLNSFVEK